MRGRLARYASWWRRGRGLSSWRQARLVAGTREARHEAWRRPGARSPRWSRRSAARRRRQALRQQRRGDEPAVGIPVLVNYLGARYPQRWDVTEENSTPSGADAQILASSRSRRSRPFSPPRTITAGRGEYAVRSDGHLRGDRPRVAAPADHRLSDRATAPSCSERGDCREVTFVQEQDLTGTLLKVSATRCTASISSPGTRSDTENVEGIGFDTIRQVLEAENYRVGTVNLATGEDCRAT